MAASIPRTPCSCSHRGSGSSRFRRLPPRHEALPRPGEGLFLRPPTATGRESRYSLRIDPSQRPIFSPFLITHNARPSPEGGEVEVVCPVFGEDGDRVGADIGQGVQVLAGTVVVHEGKMGARGSEVCGPEARRVQDIRPAGWEDGLNASGGRTRPAPRPGIRYARGQAGMERRPWRGGGKENCSSTRKRGDRFGGERRDPRAGAVRGG